MVNPASRGMNHIVREKETFKGGHSLTEFGPSWLIGYIPVSVTACSEVKHG